MKIAIVDYGSGNLRSVSKAIEKIAPVSTQVLVTLSLIHIFRKCQCQGREL